MGWPVVERKEMVALVEERKQGVVDPKNQAGFGGHRPVTRKQGVVDPKNQASFGGHHLVTRNAYADLSCSTQISQGFLYFCPLTRLVTTALRGLDCRMSYESP